MSGYRLNHRKARASISDALAKLASEAALGTVTPEEARSTPAISMCSGAASS